MTKKLNAIVEMAVKMSAPGKINEAVDDDDYPPFYEYLTDYNEEYILSEFQNDPKHNTIWFPLIEPTEYQKALNEFMQFGEIVRFPARKIYQWMGICMKNIALLNASNMINGHGQHADVYAFVDIFFNGDWEQFKQWCKRHNEDPDWSGEWTYLESVGFGDWEDLVLDDIGTTISDYGIQPLGNLACQYRENMTPSEVLVLINKILDVTHCRSDLSRLFIKGGAGQLDRVSDPSRFGAVTERKIADRRLTRGQMERLVTEVATRLLTEAGARFNEKELRRIFEKCSFFPKLKEELKRQFGEDCMEPVYENFGPGQWLTDSFDWSRSIYGTNYWYKVYERWSDFLENGELRVLLGL